MIQHSYASLNEPMLNFLNGVRAAGSYLQQDNFGACIEALSGIMPSDDPKKPTYACFVLRMDQVYPLLVEIRRKGYADKFLKWFERQDRHWAYAPLYAAFKAYTKGERFMRDFNPEVATPARLILAKLVEQGDPPPEKKEAKKPNHRRKIPPRRIHW